MIDLRDIEQQALRELSRAGADGLALAEVGASVAIRLGLEKFVKITSGAPQRVIITQQGTAYLRRVVFA